ncbi:MAG: aspartate/glutamate racemase family protein [Pseudomonadota bacterium]
MALIRVINPNSNVHVTDGLAASVAGYAVPRRLDIICETLEQGPFGIESQKDVEQVKLPLLARMKARPADAYVIACYSDPGLALCRAEIDRPVFGIMESGLATALARGDRFGVIALSEIAIKRHLPAIRAHGFDDRLAAERAVGTSVAESADEAAFDGLLAAGRTLVDQDGADVIVLGCAGMARHRKGLEAALGCPVIDPTQAAVSMAIGTVLDGTDG